MGNVTISTTDTEIYWPSDWLVDGAGTTFEAMNCPINDADNSWDDDEALTLIYRKGREKPWRVVCQNRILMETADWHDAAMYFAQYLIKYDQWLKEDACEWCGMPDKDFTDSHVCVEPPS